MCTWFVDSAVRDYNEFYNQHKEIERLVMERKGKIFDPLPVSVMKDKEIRQYSYLHILIAPSSRGKL